MFSRFLKHTPVVLLAMFTLVLMGCIEYANPLSDPSKAQVHKDLLGHWTHELVRGYEKLDISAMPDQRMKATSTTVQKENETKSVESEPVDYDFFVTKKGRHSYLNVVSSDKKSYYIFKCVVSDDKNLFTLYEVSKDRMAQAVKLKEIAGQVKGDSNDYAVTESSPNLLKWMSGLKDADWSVYGKYTR